MPTPEMTKPQTSQPLRHRQHTKHGIIPIAAYDLVFEPAGG